LPHRSGKGESARERPSIRKVRWLKKDPSEEGKKTEEKRWVGRRRISQESNIRVYCQGVGEENIRKEQRERS